MNAPAPLEVRPRPRLADLSAFVESEVARAAAERAVLATRFRAPFAPLDTPLRALRKVDGFRWGSDRQPGAFVAHGAAVTLQLSGDERFASLREQSEALFAEVLASHREVEPTPPRLVGGLAFAEGGADVEPWSSFGDGTFILPRWSYEHDAEGGVLTLAVDCRDGWEGRGPVLRAELATLWEALERGAGERSAPPGVVQVHHGDRDRYCRALTALVGAIGRGEVEKVVYSRRSRVRAAADLSPWDVLEALSEAYPDTRAFGFRRGQSTLLGATPERLFSKRGRVVDADALAGSVDARRPDAEDALLGSDKDRREHDFVVRHLLARLRPFCEAMDTPAEPTLRRLPNILHLHTPIRGRLSPGVHPADIIQALHPTPAVGGTPTDPAVQWIRANEGTPRGWYTGPVGWLDADGDADLAVALRCGVLRGASAWLYAGGGIVAGSEVDAEWEEAAVKLRPLLAALGSAP